MEYRLANNKPLPNLTQILLLMGLIKHKTRLITAECSFSASHFKGSGFRVWGEEKEFGIGVRDWGM
jgi:hypothetical protein